MCLAKKHAVALGGSGCPPLPPGDSQPGRVETYSGYRLHERPCRFTWRGDWLAVRRVLARWQEPEILCFTVCASDSCSYVLKYYPGRDAWEVRILSGSDSCPA